jgi:AmmeMemoRadiSam system protein A
MGGGNPMLNREERDSLLDLARSTIEDKLHNRRAEEYRPISAKLEEPCGAFVTLHKGGTLRGCIGLVQASKPLYKSVREMARAAAFEDPRFPPLRPEEYDEIDIEISVMSPLKRIRDVAEIEVGTHGILMKQGYRQGLLLPQVATEQGWNRNKFLEQTCFKAGLMGDCWESEDTEIYIFSAEVFGEKDRP